MSRSAESFRSIASWMLQRIVVLAAVGLVCVVSLQVWLERQRHIEQFRDMMHLVVEVSSRGIANGLWDIEYEQVQTLLQHLAELEAVSKVRVVAAVTGQEFVAISSDMHDKAPSFTASIASPNHEAESLGIIEIWADHAYYRSLLWQTQLNVIPGYLLFTVLLCLMVAWVMQRDLGMPLRQFAEFARNLHPQELSRPLNIERPSRARKDEIDMVVQGFEHLQSALDRHIKDLDGLVQERTQELQVMVDEVKRLSQIDALTGAWNRRGMDIRLPAEIERSTRYSRPLSVIFTDIDHFKRINDTHGHDIGDAVLHDVASRLQQQLREHVDWMVRFGGEEFVIFLPETLRSEAQSIAQRLAHNMRSTPWRGEQGLELSLTCSFGVTQYHADDSAHSFLKRADDLLYSAKAQGRDRVVVG